MQELSMRKFHRPSLFSQYEEPLAKRLVLSGLGGVADPVGESLMLHFVFWQRQIGNCRRASSRLCFRIGRHVSDAGRVLAAT
jgi:hypothetical protein